MKLPRDIDEMCIRDRPFSMDQLLDLASQMLPEPKLKTA